MTVDWVFRNSREPSENTYVENLVTNTRTVYFDIILKDTGEVVYSSPYIPLGTRLESITLDTELPAGEYEAICKYYLVDDDYQVITNLQVTVKLRILEDVPAEN